VNISVGYAMELQGYGTWCCP